MTSLKFGTSGLRGLAIELAGPPAAAYTRAFLDHLASLGEYGPGKSIALAMDLRSTSPEIAGWCAAAVASTGGKLVNLGQVPTPALAMYAMSRGIPAIMVTGSHIPDDRNGLKFYRTAGEIDKTDEAAINAAHAALASVSITSPAPMPVADKTAALEYCARYAAPFAGLLSGKTIGVFQHSSVGRDLFVDILEVAGAKTIALGRSDVFVPVDTEALRPEDTAALARWAQENRFDAIVSSDGDADRPLIADENGAFVPGDTVGALTTKFLRADCIVTPVTSNSALEARLAAIAVKRTSVGSPYVIAGMEDAAANFKRIIGFEANGGVLQASAMEIGGKTLPALPTRDSVLPILCVLSAAAKEKKKLSELVRDLNLNAKHSDRVESYERSTSTAFISKICDPASHEFKTLWAALGLTDALTPVYDLTDGAKIMIGESSIHFRPSGNAPELRVYCEAPSLEQAKQWVEIGKTAAKDFAET